MRSEPAAAYAAEGAGRSISLPLKLDESETAPGGGVCAPLCFGVYYRGWGGGEWLIVRVVAGKSKMSEASVLLDCVKTSSRSL